jgi:hypothetical protein
VRGNPVIPNKPEDIAFVDSLVKQVRLSVRKGLQIIFINEL